MSAHPPIAAEKQTFRKVREGPEPDSTAAPGTTGSASLREVVEQVLGLLQVGQVDTFFEPSIDRRDRIVRLFLFPAAGPISSKADSCAQLQRLCFLFLGDLNCTLVASDRAGR